MSFSVSDLKAYVMTGNTFPVDDAKFDEEISKDAFRQLIPLDSSIYQVYVTFPFSASTILLTRVHRSRKPNQALSP